jgi:very-short-patch-repair endonuclease
MPKLAVVDSAALMAILSRQHNVIGRDQALACGVSEKSMRHRLRPEGPWQVALPGVYVAHTGAISDIQRVVAAFLHAGPALAVTGTAAVACYGIPCKPSSHIDVLVPATCRRCDAGFARLHRTKVAPQVLMVDGAVRYAAPARAIADAARQLADTADVRALVAAGVQRGKVSIWQLEEELASGSPRGSARLRQTLAEVADGVRSSAEGDLHTLIRKSSLPQPLYNPQLFVGSTFLACPDAWWREYGVAAEVDSRAWHLSPADWEQTMARHDRMAAQGIVVLHFPPRRVRAEGRQVIKEISNALGASRGPLPHIVTVPASRV